MMGVWMGGAMESNNKIQKEADFWGAIVSIDNTDADQRTVSISYPDELGGWREWKWWWLICIIL